MIKNAIQARQHVIDEFVALTEANQALIDLTVYLTSSKFHTDTTVQVSDVLARLRPIQTAIADADFNNTQARNLLRPAHA